MHLLAALAAFCFASGELAQDRTPSAQWNDLVAAAKAEGKVVLLGPPDPQVRQALPAAFKARFGVTLEYLGTRGGDTTARLRAERSAGLHTVDVAFGGSDTMAGVYYAEKMLAPLKPALIPAGRARRARNRPKANSVVVVMDPEGLYVLRLFNTLNSGDLRQHAVRRSGPASQRARPAGPEMEGPHSRIDPSMSAAAASVMRTRFYLQFGEAFVKQLYVDQQPAIARDRHTITDWLLRGTYPITFDAEEDQVDRMRKDGWPVTALYELSDMPGTLSAGVGEMALFDQAPHPHAAQLFVNWMASKEGLEIYARTRGEAPTRNDIDASSFLPAELIPQAGKDYLDIHDWQTSVAPRQKVQALMKELLRAPRNH